MTSEGLSSSRRASSSPPASLRHFERSVPASHVSELVAQASRGCRNPRAPHSLLHSLIRSVASVEVVPRNVVSNAADCQVAEAPTVGAPSLPPPQTVQTVQDTAKTQIELLNKANEHVVQRCNELEAENRRLRESHERVVAENETLKRTIAQQREEIDEQFHMICELQREVPKIS